VVESYMRCMNYYCETELEDWQIKKITPKRFSKNRFCVTCKRLRNCRNMDYIRCVKCGAKLERTTHRLECPIHKVERNRIVSLEYYHKNKDRYNLARKRVNDLKRIQYNLARKKVYDFKRMQLKI